MAGHGRPRPAMAWKAGQDWPWTVMACNGRPSLAMTMTSHCWPWLVMAGWLAIAGFARQWQAMASYGLQTLAQSGRI